MGLGALALVGVISLALVSRDSMPPPSVVTDGLDPAVAKLIEDTLEAVRQMPRSGAAWGKLGSVLMHYEFVEEGSAAFARAEKLSPTEPRWPYLHALLLFNHDATVAATKLERAVELCGDTPDMPRLRLGQFLAEHGRDAEAERHFNALLSSSPGHAPAMLGLARVFQARGNLKQSTNILQRCLGDRHTARSAHALLAAIQRALGQAAEAEVTARRSRALPVDEPWPDPFWDEAVVWRTGLKVKIEEASNLIDRGRIDGALAILVGITREYPADDEAWYLMGWALNQTQRGREAEQALREHLRRSPQSPKGHSQLAVSLLQQRRYPEAILVLEAGVRLKPTWREFHSNLGFACVQLGRDDDAIRHFRNALSSDPNYVATYTALAELLERRGESGEARGLLQQAMGIDPGNSRALALLQRLPP